MSRDDDVAAINAMVAAAGPRIDALLTDRNDALAKAKSEPTIRNALIALLALAERWAVKIDWEWGTCRDIDGIEADGDLEPEIILAREALNNG